jgi:hypothetical protein
MFAEFGQAKSLPYRRDGIYSFVSFLTRYLAMIRLQVELLSYERELILVTTEAFI